MSTETEPIPKTTTHDEAFDRRMDLVMESVDLHHTCLLGYLRRLAGPTDAEDILQELWKYVVVHFTEENITCLPLLRRKAHQLFIDHYRKRRSQTRLMEQVAEEPPPVTGEMIHSEAEEERLAAKFFEDFPVDLTDIQKQLLWHHARYGLTFTELEAKFGIPASTAHDWVKTGRAKLQKLINQD